MQSDEPLNLDEYLASRFSSVQDKKLEIYEALLGAILRLYVPSNKKVRINLLKASTDTILDITLDDNGTAKISWEEAQ